MSATIEPKALEEALQIAIPPSSFLFQFQSLISYIILKLH